MNFINQLQNQYDKLWKHIIRPSRSSYSQQLLGNTTIIIKQREFIRKDFQLSNKRGYDFSCSLWLPIDLKEFPCVIYLHGNSSNRTEGMEYLRKLLINNIALCTFDFSGCGNAEGEYVSLGYYQKEDLEEVILYLKKQFKINNIALWGRSMGAVTALLYLAQHQGIKCLVVDSPFKSLKTLVQDMAKKSTKVPNWVLRSVFKIISGTIQQRAGFNIYDLNPLQKAVPYLYLPAFFIVGISDQIIPLQHTKDLFQEYGGDDKCIKMVKGGHNESRPKECVREVIRFLLIRFSREDQIEHQQAIKEEINSIFPSKVVSQERQQVQKQQFSWKKMFSIFQKNPQKQNKPQKSNNEVNILQKQIKIKQRHIQYSVQNVTSKNIE